MISVAIVDDHPAVRAGLVALLRAEPGFWIAGTGGSAADALALAHEQAPDVLLIDYRLKDQDGLSATAAIKRRAPRVNVIVYTGFSTAFLMLPAALAGARGVISKESFATELFDAIRVAARGARVPMVIDRDAFALVQERLDAEDIVLLGMLLNGSSPNDAASVLGVPPAEVAQRIETMGRLLSPDRGRLEVER